MLNKSQVRKTQWLLTLLSNEGRNTVTYNHLVITIIVIYLRYLFTGSEPAKVLASDGQLI